ncbi:MAG TPA: HigA family addiction module antitoxin [Bryobacteraceae bacterium]|nr:HigA family addiction module antitoxin [Bryobacteraceae bacterium]
MKSRVVGATEFKAKCLAFLDEIDRKGSTITVTKRGRPVATVGPAKRRPWKSPEGAWIGKVHIPKELLQEDAMAVTAIHPGEHLAEELKELAMSAAELARKLDVPTNRITGILNGQRAITGDTALRLAHFFGTSPEFWLNLQSLYELRIARKKVGRSIHALPRLKRPERVPA